MCRKCLNKVPLPVPSAWSCPTFVLFCAGFSHLLPQKCAPLSRAEMRYYIGILVGEGAVRPLSLHSQFHAPFGRLFFRARPNRHSHSYSEDVDVRICFPLPCSLFVRRRRCRLNLYFPLLASHRDLSLPPPPPPLYGLCPFLSQFLRGP